MERTPNKLHKIIITKKERIKKVTRKRGARRYVELISPLQALIRWAAKTLTFYFRGR
jgi:hypothetical protein